MSLEAEKAMQSSFFGCQVETEQLRALQFAAEQAEKANDAKKALVRTLTSRKGPQMRKPGH